MKIIVNPHTIEIDKEPINEKEIDITKCEFEFDEAITDDFVKEAYFTFGGTSYKEIIVDNQCPIPYEVLEKKGQVEIGVVAFKVENEDVIKRYNPTPAYFNTWDGSLKGNAENSEPITPSEMEQYEQALQNGLNKIDEKISEADDKIEEMDETIETANTVIGEAETLNIDVNKVGKEATVDLTRKNGTHKEVTIRDGYDLEYDWQGTELGIKREDESEFEYVDLKGEKGDTYFATFSIIDAHLIMNKPEQITQFNFHLDERGHLQMEVGV